MANGLTDSLQRYEVYTLVDLLLPQWLGKQDASTAPTAVYTSMHFVPRDLSAAWKTNRIKTFLRDCLTVFQQQGSARQAHHLCEGLHIAFLAPQDEESVSNQTAKGETIVILLQTTSDYWLPFDGGSPAQWLWTRVSASSFENLWEVRSRVKTLEFHVKWLPKISSEPFRSDPVWTAANAKATEDLFYQTVDVQFVLFHEVWSIFLQDLP